VNLSGYRCWWFFKAANERHHLAGVAFVMGKGQDNAVGNAGRVDGVSRGARMRNMVWRNHQNNATSRLLDKGDIMAAAWRLSAAMKNQVA